MLWLQCLLLLRRGWNRLRRLRRRCTRQLCRGCCRRQLLPGQRAQHGHLGSCREALQRRYAEAAEVGGAQLCKRVWRHRSTRLLLLLLLLLLLRLRLRLHSGLRLRHCCLRLPHHDARISKRHTCSKCASAPHHIDQMLHDADACWGSCNCLKRCACTNRSIQP